MSNEHPPPPYLPENGDVTSWQDVKIKSTPKNFKADLLSTTFPLGAHKIVGDSFVYDSTDKFTPVIVEDSEQIEIEAEESIDPFTLEGLDGARSYVNNLFRQANDIRMEQVEKKVTTEDFENFYQSTRSHVSTLQENIRELKDLTESDDDTLVEEKAIVFKKNIELLQNMVDSLQGWEFSGEPLMIEQGESAEKLLKENHLIERYLSALGLSEDQINQKTSLLPESKGRETILRNANEWDLQNREGWFDKMTLRIRKMSEYIKSVKDHVPSSMSDQYTRLKENFIKVSLHLSEQNRFLKKEAGAVDNYTELETAARELFASAEKFGDDLLQVQQAGIESSNNEKSEEGERVRARLVVEPRGESDKIKTVFKDRIPMGSYPENQDPGIIKKGPTIMSGDLLRNFEQGDKNLLDVFNDKFQEIDQAIYENIFPKINESEWTKTDELDFGFLRDTYRKFADVADAIEKEINQRGRVNPDLQENFDTYYNQLSKAIRHYENLIASGSPLFKQGQEEVPAEPVVSGDAEQSADEANAGTAEPNDHEKVAEVMASILEYTPLEKFEDRISDVRSRLLNSTSLPQSFEYKPKEASVPVTPPEFEAYGNARQSWLEAKELHDSLQERSRLQTEEYYGKWWNKTRSTVGFSPDLPPEITALKQEAAAATALYHKASQELLAAKSLDASPETKKKLERHGRMIAHSLLLRNSNDLIEAQKQGLVMKDSAASDFIEKHGKKLRLTFAGLVGLATGGVFTGAWAVGRALAGAAVTGAATEFVGRKLDARVEAKQTEYSEKYKEEVESIIATIQSKQEKKEALSADELLDIQAKLGALYAVVDKATKDRIRGVLATGFATSVLFGLGASELAEGLAPTPEVGVEVNSSAAGGTPETGVSASGGEEGSAQPPSEPPAAATAQPSTPAAEAPKVTEYTAQKGDNFWDIMEGQTEAGKPAHLAHVDEVHRQELVDLVRDEIEKDPDTLERLGFGKDADHLQIGAEVDTAKLNEMAEQIAKEKGWYQAEVAADAPDKVAAAPEAAGGAAESASAGASSEVANASVSEKIPTKVLPDKIIDYGINYQGGSQNGAGYMKFEADFEKNFVEKIQGPPQSGGLLSFFLGDKPNTTNVFKLFDSYPMEEFNKLETLDAATLAKEFNENGIDMRHYLAYKDNFSEWEKAGLVINPKDKFGDVLRTAFMRSLEQAPKA